MTPEEVLQTKKTFALIGASQDREKYGYKLLRTLVDAGYTVYPINPRYEAIDGVRCYKSLAEMPGAADVVVIALAPDNTERILDQITRDRAGLIWLPPGCGSDAAEEKCRGLGIDYLSDVCPVGTLARMKLRKS